ISRHRDWNGHTSADQLCDARLSGVILGSRLRSCLGYPKFRMARPFVRLRSNCLRETHRGCLPRSQILTKNSFLLQADDSPPNDAAIISGRSARLGIISWLFFLWEQIRYI